MGGPFDADAEATFRRGCRGIRQATTNVDRDVGVDLEKGAVHDGGGHDLDALVTAVFVVARVLRWLPLAALTTTWDNYAQASLN